GYAADTRSTSGSGLNESDIQVYLNDSSDQRNLLHYAAGKRDSADAAASLGSQFGQAGFAASWDTCSFAPGHYSLTVWVSSLATPQGSQSPNLHDAFAVQPANRTFHLRRCPPTEGTACADLLHGSSTAIRGGTATNRLGVVAEGSELRLFVNGQEVGQVRDD